LSRRSCGCTLSSGVPIGTESASGRLRAVAGSGLELAGTASCACERVVCNDSIEACIASTRRDPRGWLGRTVCGVGIACGAYGRLHAVAGGGFELACFTCRTGAAAGERINLNDCGKIFLDL